MQYCTAVEELETSFIRVKSEANLGQSQAVMEAVIQLMSTDYCVRYDSQNWL